MNNSININFENLNYNLYEILNVKHDASIKKIKKAYRKLIIKYHPDKTEKFDEDIFEHLTLAYQILSNELNRSKYDKYLKSENSKQSFTELKNKWQNDSKTLTSNFPKSKGEAYSSFQILTKKLNKQHGVTDSLDVTPFTKNQLTSKVNNLQSKRSKLKIKQRKFKNGFHNDFVNDKETEHDTIIPYEADNIITDDNRHKHNYAGLDQIGKLYSEDETIQNSNFSS